MDEESGVIDERADNLQNGCVDCQKPTLCCGVLPTIEQAGAIAVGLCEELEASEQAFFVAGFQECVKFLSPE